MRSIGIAAVALTSTAAQAQVKSLQQYEAIVDPAIDATAPIFNLTVAGAVANTIFEIWRFEHKTLLQGYEQMVDAATAQAVTTNTIKDFKIRLKPGMERARAVVAKLKKDVEIYERRFPGFTAAGYAPPTDPANPEAVEWPHYDAIRNALQHYEFDAVRRKDGQDTPGRFQLDDAEKTLDQRIEAANKAILDVLQRLTKAGYALTQLSPTMRYLEDPLGDLHVAMVGVENMAATLLKAGHTPKAQVRIIFGNYSTNLLFHIQIVSPVADGKPQLRPDSLYPIPLDPRKETDEYNRRWLPIEPGDQVVIRALTMGEQRAHLLLQKIEGGQVRLDLNSLSRNPYYLGYEVPQGHRTLIGKWYPIRETYAWQLSGGLNGDAGMSAARISSSDGKTFRSFGPPLVLENDRLEWALPKDATIRDYAEAGGYGEAVVSGQTTVEKQGPSVLPISDKDRVELKEEGSGKLAVVLQVW